MNTTSRTTGETLGFSFFLPVLLSFNSPPSLITIQRNTTVQMKKQEAQANIWKTSTTFTTWLYMTKPANITNQYAQYALDWHTLLTFVAQTDYICNKEHAPLRIAKASLADPSWPERSRGFGRHRLSALPQSNCQKRASLLRKGAAGHIRIPCHSSEKRTGSQEFMAALSAGGLPVVDTQ